MIIQFNDPCEWFWWHGDERIKWMCMEEDYSDYQVPCFEVHLN